MFVQRPILKPRSQANLKNRLGSSLWGDEKCPRRVLAISPVWGSKRGSNVPKVNNPWAKNLFAITSGLNSKEHSTNSSDRYLPKHGQPRIQRHRHDPLYET
ncbi:unnamed protein product, partial [Sphacelaria rigidula]